MRYNLVYIHTANTEKIYKPKHLLCGGDYITLHNTPIKPRHFGVKLLSMMDGTFSTPFILLMDNFHMLLERLSLISENRIIQDAITGNTTTDSSPNSNNGMSLYSKGDIDSLQSVLMDKNYLFTITLTVQLVKERYPLSDPSDKERHAFHTYRITDTIVKIHSNLYVIPPANGSDSFVSNRKYREKFKNHFTNI